MRTLAVRARVPGAVIERAERVGGEAPIALMHEHALRLALDAAGVEFTNGDVSGVKLRRP